MVGVGPNPALALEHREKKLAEPYLQLGSVGVASNPAGATPTIKLPKEGIHLGSPSLGVVARLEANDLALVNVKLIKESSRTARRAATLPPLHRLRRPSIAVSRASAPALPS
jgi:hypothetical protein